MFSERFLVFAGMHIPEADSAVFAPTGECFSIRAECDAVDTIRMSRECFLVFAGVCVPEVDSAIVTPTGECLSIWTECDAVDTHFIRCEPGLVCTCAEIP